MKKTNKTELSKYFFMAGCSAGIIGMLFTNNYWLFASVIFFLGANYLK